MYLQENEDHRKELINTRNKENNTPLHLACLADNQEYIQVYLKAYSYF